MADAEMKLREGNFDLIERQAGELREMRVVFERIMVEYKDGYEHWDWYGYIRNYLAAAPAEGAKPHVLNKAERDALNRALEASVTAVDDSAEGAKDE